MSCLPGDTNPELAGANDVRRGDQHCVRGEDQRIQRDPAGGALGFAPQQTSEGQVLVEGILLFCNTLYCKHTDFCTYFVRLLINFFTHHLSTLLKLWDQFQDWPEEGVVKFSKFATRYREGLDLVIRDIDCTIQAGEKVSISCLVGSTNDDIFVCGLQQFSDKNMTSMTR